MFGRWIVLLGLLLTLQATVALSLGRVAASLPSHQSATGSALLR